MLWLELFVNGMIGGDKHFVLRIIPIINKMSVYSKKTKLF